MVSDVADIVGVWEFDIKGNCEIAFITFLICVVVTVAIVTNFMSRSYPT